MANRIPKAKNIPELRINIEGLKRHSLLLFFSPEPSLSAEDRKLRAWLLHTLTSAARHYTRARDIVEKQDNADQTLGDGAVLHVLDTIEHIEDCVSATFRVCAALKRMQLLSSENDVTKAFNESFSALSKIRNQFEHMHSQIVANETGTGPISIAFGDEGRTIDFRKLTMETERLHGLIEYSFGEIGKLYPEFDIHSHSEAQRPLKLTMTASVVVVENGVERPE